MSSHPAPSALRNGDALWAALCVQLQEQTTAQQFNTWLRPLRGELHGNEL
ncbi:MAG: DnaA N-terminal domain-containing protein, partial [Acidithiobacillus ferriphilus]